MRSPPGDTKRRHSEPRGIDWSLPGADHKESCEKKGIQKQHEEQKSHICRAQPRIFIVNQSIAKWGIHHLRAESVLFTQVAVLLAQQTGTREFGQQKERKIPSLATQLDHDLKEPLDFTHLWIQTDTFTSLVYISLKWSSLNMDYRMPSECNSKYLLSAHSSRAVTVPKGIRLSYIRVVPDQWLLRRIHTVNMQVYRAHPEITLHWIWDRAWLACVFLPGSLMMPDHLETQHCVTPSESSQASSNLMRELGVRALKLVKAETKTSTNISVNKSVYCSRVPWVR